VSNQKPSAPQSERSLYPSSPESPLPLASPTFGYRVRVVLVLASLLGFVAIYLGLLAGSVWLTWHSWFGGGSGSGVIIDLALMAVSPMLVLFFAKGLWQRDLFEDDHWLEVSENEQPDLYAFIRRLCSEAKSPMPGRIFLAWDVNAMVTYPNSLLSLFWPTRKNLLIGMGLANGLHLSELKAVLAHEFGHISQSSTKLGQFVYVTNQICVNVVCGHVCWDLFLARWRTCDLIISWPAWILTVVMSVLRTLLSLLFYVTNRFSYSLKRSMELNADLHAVRLCGSDAIVSGLWKSDRALMSLELSKSDLISLAQHRRYSDDIFHHQLEALAKLNETIRRDAVNAQLVEYMLRPYERGTELHFPERPDRATSAWDVHPCARDREINAKRKYLDHPADDRPTWALIRNPEQVRARLSALFYREICEIEVEHEALLPAADVTSMIAEEHREMRQGEHYAGFYQDRHIRPGKVRELAQEVETSAKDGTIDEAALREEIGSWVGSPMKEAAEALRSIHDEFQELQKVHCHPSSPTFVFRGQKLSTKDLERCSAQLETELEELQQHMHEGDRAFFRYFYWLSGAESRGSDAVRAELTQRYEFLEVVQELVTKLHEIESKTLPILHAHTAGAQFTPAEVEHIRETFAEGRNELDRAFRRSAALILPRLAHLDEENSAASFVLPTKKVVPPLPEGEISADWINDYLHQFDQVLTRLRKLHFKNLGQLLRLQESLDPELFPQAESKIASEGETAEAQKSYA